MTALPCSGQELKGSQGGGTLAHWAVEVRSRLYLCTSKQTPVLSKDDFTVQCSVSYILQCFFKKWDCEVGMYNGIRNWDFCSEGGF